MYCPDFIFIFKTQWVWNYSNIKQDTTVLLDSAQLTFAHKHIHTQITVGGFSAPWRAPTFTTVPTLSLPSFHTDQNGTYQYFIMAVWRMNRLWEKNGRKARAFEAKGSSLYHIHLCLTDIWHTMLTHSWPPLLNERHLSISPCICGHVCVWGGNVCLWRVSALPSSLGPYGEEQQEWWALYLRPMFALLSVTRNVCVLQTSA